MEENKLKYFAVEFYSDTYEDEVEEEHFFKTEEGATKFFEEFVNKKKNLTAGMFTADIALFRDYTYPEWAERVASWTILRDGKPCKVQKLVLRTVTLEFED